MRPPFPNDLPPPYAEDAPTTVDEALYVHEMWGEDQPTRVADTVGGPRRPRPARERMAPEHALMLGLGFFVGFWGTGAAFLSVASWCLSQ